MKLFVSILFFVITFNSFVCGVYDHTSNTVLALKLGEDKKAISGDGLKILQAVQKDATELLDKREYPGQPSPKIPNGMLIKFTICLRMDREEKTVFDPYSLISGKLDGRVNVLSLTYNGVPTEQSKPLYRVKEPTSYSYFIRFVFTPGNYYTACEMRRITPAPETVIQHICSDSNIKKIINEKKLHAVGYTRDMFIGHTEKKESGKFLLCYALFIEPTTDDANAILAAKLEGKVPVSGDDIQILEKVQHESWSYLERRRNPVGWNTRLPVQSNAILIQFTVSHKKNVNLLSVTHNANPLHLDPGSKYKVMGPEENVRYRRISDPTSCITPDSMAEIISLAENFIQEICADQNVKAAVEDKKLHAVGYTQDYILGSIDQTNLGIYLHCLVVLTEPSIEKANSALAAKLEGKVPLSGAGLEVLDEVQRKALSYMVTRSDPDKWNASFPVLSNGMLIQFTVRLSQFSAAPPPEGISLLSLTYNGVPVHLAPGCRHKVKNPREKDEYVRVVGPDISHLRAENIKNTFSAAETIIQDICADENVKKIIDAKKLLAVGYTRDFFNCFNEEYTIFSSHVGTYLQCFVVLIEHKANTVVNTPKTSPKITEPN